MSNKPYEVDVTLFALFLNRMKAAVVIAALICVAQCALRSEEEAAVKAMGDPCDTVFCSLGQECVIKVSGVFMVR